MDYDTTFCGLNKVNCIWYDFVLKNYKREWFYDPFEVIVFDEQHIGYGAHTSEPKAERRLLLSRGQLIQKNREDKLNKLI